MNDDQEEHFFYSTLSSFEELLETHGVQKVLESLDGKTYQRISYHINNNKWYDD